jgi:hypothetical protein
MSGIVSGINYNLLFSQQSASDISTSMLNTLYGGSTTGSSTFATTGNPLLDLKLAQQNQTTDVAQEALQPQVMQAVASFKTAVAKATSIQSALGNPNIQQVLLTANGLSNYIGETGLVQKVLLSDPYDPKSLVHRLGDGTMLSTVQTYNFAKNGLAELRNPAIISTLTNAYAEVKWRQSLDQATPGLSNALTFLSQASSIKSVTDITGNLANFEVVTTALGIPQSIINQDATAQARAINARLDYAKLQNPNYVNGLTEQYLVTMQANHQTNSTAGTDLTTLAVRASGLVV